MHEILEEVRNVYNSHNTNHLQMVATEYGIDDATFLEHNELVEVLVAVEYENFFK